MPLCAAATHAVSISRIRQSLPRIFERRKARSERHLGAPPVLLPLFPCRAASSSPGDSERDESETETNKTPPDKSSDAYYREALSKARECIFSAPKGQLLGRAGRRCTLEDGERHALRAVAAERSASSSRPDSGAGACLSGEREKNVKSKKKSFFTNCFFLFFLFESHKKEKKGTGVFFLLDDCARGIKSRRKKKQNRAQKATPTLKRPHTKLLSLSL